MGLKKLTLILATLALPAAAEDADLDLRIALIDEFIACSGMEDAERLTCYDDLSLRVPEMMTAGIDSQSDSCELEGWKIGRRGVIPYATGALSCKSGKMDYRFYDADTGEFLESGFTFFTGYAFQIYMDTREPPKEVEMKYVIEQN